MSNTFPHHASMPRFMQPVSEERTDPPAADTVRPPDVEMHNLAADPANQPPLRPLTVSSGSRSPRGAIVEYDLFNYLR